MQLPKEVTYAFRVELQERERLEYILELGQVKTLSGPSTASRTGWKPIAAEGTGSIFVL